MHNPRGGRQFVPLTYVIHKKEGLVVSTGSERLTFAEVRVHQDLLLSDPDFNPEFNQILDGRQVKGLDMSTDEARALARRAIFSATSKRAFVATDPAIFGMGRLFQAYHEMTRFPSQVRVFYGLPDALEWLGLESLP